MQNQIIDLKEEYGLQGGALECVCMNRPFADDREWRRPAVIVAPGGGYGHCSEREATNVAVAFVARGFQGKANEKRKNGEQINIAIMKKNKKFQKEQMEKEGYTVFEEFFVDRM